jgi:hypothetical protein
MRMNYGFIGIASKNSAEFKGFDILQSVKYILNGISADEKFRFGY